MAQNPYEKIYDDLNITISQETTFDEAQSIAVHLGYIYNTFGLMVKDFINLLGYRFKADKEGTKNHGSRPGRKEGGWEGKGEQREGDEVMEGKWAKGAPNRLIKQISSLSREGSREVSEKVLRQKLLKLRQQKDPIDKETMINENRDNDRSRNGENPVKKIRMRRHRQVVCEVIDISSEDEQKEEQMSEEEERRMRTRSHVRGHSNDAAVSNGNNNNNSNTQNSNNTNKTSHRGRGRRGRGRGRPARVISQSQSNEDPFQIIYNVPYKRHKMQQSSFRNDKDSSNHSMTDNHHDNKKQQLIQKKTIKSAQNLPTKTHQHQYNTPSFLNKVMTSYVQSKQALNHSKHHLDKQSPKQSIKQRIQRLQRQYQEEERIRQRMYERINHQNNCGIENDGDDCQNNGGEDDDKGDDSNEEQYEEEMQLEDNGQKDQDDNRLQEEFSLGQAIGRYIVPFHQIAHSNHNNNKNSHNRNNQDNNNSQHNNNNKQAYLQLINQSIQQQYEENLAIDQQYEYDHESQPQSQQPQMSQPSEQDYISHHELSFHPSQDQFVREVPQNQPLNSDKPQKRPQQRPQQTLSQQYEVQRQKQVLKNHKQHATSSNQHNNNPSSQPNDMNYELLGQGQLNRSNDSYEKVVFDSFQKNDGVNGLQNCQERHYSSQKVISREENGQNGKETSKSIESINQEKNMAQNGHSNLIVHQRAQHTIQQDKEQVLRVLQQFSDQQHQHELKPHNQNPTQAYPSQTVITPNPTTPPKPHTPHLTTTPQTHPTPQHILPTAPNRLQLNKFTKKNQKHIEIIQLE